MRFTAKLCSKYRELLSEYSALPVKSQGRTTIISVHQILVSELPRKTQHSQALDGTIL